MVGLSTFPIRLGSLLEETDLAVEEVRVCSFWERGDSSPLFPPLATGRCESPGFGSSGVRVGSEIRN